MQRTRLNLLLDDLWNRFSRFFQNPWRRLTLLAIALLSGNFLATVFPPAIGQTPTWDPVVAFIIILITETFSFFYYKQGDRPTTAPKTSAEPAKGTQSQFVIDLLNAFKIGLLYGITVSAINVGS